nr:hypothetical protein MRV80_mgp12 [Batrachospermum sp.]UNB13420.1 hypothetical protein [Batrachospermum sp.]
MFKFADFSIVLVIIKESQLVIHANYRLLASNYRLLASNYRLSTNGSYHS